MICLAVDETELAVNCQQLHGFWTSKTSVALTNHYGYVYDRETTNVIAHEWGNWWKLIIKIINHWPFLVVQHLDLLEGPKKIKHIPNIVSVHMVDFKNGKWTIFLRKSQKMEYPTSADEAHCHFPTNSWDFVTPGTITNFVLISPCSHDAELNPKPEHLIRSLLRIYVGSSIMRGSYHAFMYLNMSERIPDLVEGCCGWLTQILPQNGWFIRESPSINGRFAGTSILGNPHNI